MTGTVQQHYGSADITAKILAAVPWSPADGKPLEAAQLYPFDQLHGRELLATRDHAARLAPGAGDHLLDIGAGIGGPARFFAQTCGCRVTGIDLTPDFVETARTLSDLCGLGDKLTFLQGDAAAIPLEDGSFDHAYSYYVGMNLPDKDAVLAEAFRLLRPGGRLLWTEVTAGGDDPTYPLPWATNAAVSHVEPRARLAGRFEDAGFTVTAVDDETAAHLDLARQMKAAGRVPSEGQQQANQVVLGPDFVQRRMNYIASLGAGQIVSTIIEASKPA